MLVVTAGRVGSALSQNPSGGLSQTSAVHTVCGGTVVETFVSSNGGLPTACALLEGPLTGDADATAAAAGEEASPPDTVVTAFWLVVTVGPVTETSFGPAKLSQCTRPHQASKMREYENDTADKTCPCCQP